MNVDTLQTALEALAAARGTDAGAHPRVKQIVDLARGWWFAQPEAEREAVVERVSDSVRQAFVDRGWWVPPGHAAPASTPSDWEWIPPPTVAPDPDQADWLEDFAPPSHGVLPYDWAHDKILLFQEARPRNHFGITRSVSMHRSVLGDGRGAMAYWHPWYEPEHGSAEKGYGPFLTASTAQRIGYLCRNVDAAIAGGFMAWGVDWEGALLGPDALVIVGEACRYARAAGLWTYGVPKAGWQHHLKANIASRKELDLWADEHLDMLVWWDPSATSEALREQTLVSQDNGLRIPVTALAYPYKGIPPAEDRKVIRDFRGIFNPGQSDRDGEVKALVDYAKGIQA